MPSKYERACEELDRLYATLPAVRCKRLCGESCGPMILTDLEARRLQVATHRKPRCLPMITTPADVRCVYLNAEQTKCTAYAVRPLICRIWGTVKRLSCPHGCVPDRWLSDREFLEVAQAIERIGGGRILHTTPDGTGFHAGETFAALGAGQTARTDAAIEHEAEIVRGLRALHGGRILAAVPKNEDG
jgi:hypothetical protein